MVDDAANEAVKPARGRGAWWPASVSPAAQQRTRVLAAVERAIAEGRKVRMVYASAVRGGQATERVVRPYTVMRHIRGWYVTGHCELRGDVRVFKVGRIRSLSQTAEPYAIPGDFDLDSYFGGGWGILRSDSARWENRQSRVAAF